MRQTHNLDLFLHIPKTGGSTLKKCVGAIIFDYSRGTPSDLDYVPDLPEELKKYWYQGVFYYPVGFFIAPRSEAKRNSAAALQQSSLQAVIGHFSYGIHRYSRKNCRYITMLREPVERVLSLFAHLKCQQALQPEIELADVLRQSGDAGWRKSLLTWYSLQPNCSESEIRRHSWQLFHNDQTRRIAGLHGRVSDVQMLEQAKRNLKEKFLVTGITERFDESLVMMAGKLGWPKVPNYLRVLVNRRRHEAPPIISSEREIVAQENSLDIELYKYALQLYEQAMEREGPTFGARVVAFQQENRQFQERHSDLAAMSDL